MAKEVGEKTVWCHRSHERKGFQGGSGQLTKSQVFDPATSLLEIYLTRRPLCKTIIPGGAPSAMEYMAAEPLP